MCLSTPVSAPEAQDAQVPGSSAQALGPASAKCTAMTMDLSPELPSDLGSTSKQRNAPRDVDDAAHEDKHRKGFYQFCMMKLMIKCQNEATEIYEQFDEVQESLRGHLNWQLGHDTPVSEVLAAMDHGHIRRLEDREKQLRNQWDEKTVQLRNLEQICEKIERSEELEVEDLRLLKKCLDWAEKDDNLG